MDFVLQHADRELSPGCFLISCLLKEAMFSISPFAEMGILRTVLPLGVMVSLGVFVLISRAQS